MGPIPGKQAEEEEGYTVRSVLHPVLHAGMLTMILLQIPCKTSDEIKLHACKVPHMHANACSDGVSHQTLQSLGTFFPRVPAAGNTCLL